MLDSPSPVQRHALPIAVVAALLLTLSGVHLYVDQLFITFVHESSHGLAAILTGGRLLSFYVHADTSGLAMTAGGFRPLVLVAGYMGSCLWGGAMLVAARRQGWEKAVMWGLAGFLLLSTLLFVRNLFGFAAGLGMGAFFAWVAWHGRGWQLSLLLSFLAIESIFNAFVDLRDLVVISSSGVAVTDAQLMSRELTLGLVPPIIFAIGIAALAIVVFAVFLRLALRPDAEPDPVSQERP